LAAAKIYDERRLSRVGRGAPDQRPSMGQNMAKGRRTEIEYLNGFVVREGEQIGIQARANERGEIQRKSCFSPQNSHSSAVQCVLFQQLMRQIRWFADQPNFAPDQRI
jgi:hypothetical protein